MAERMAGLSSPFQTHNVATTKATELWVDPAEHPFCLTTVAPPE